MILVFKMPLPLDSICPILKLFSILKHLPLLIWKDREIWRLLHGKMSEKWLNWPVWL